MRSASGFAIVTIMVLSISFQTAHAGLLGMPLNLRIAVQSAGTVWAGPALQSDADSIIASASIDC